MNPDAATARATFCNAPPADDLNAPDRVQRLAAPWHELWWFASIDSTQRRARAEAAAGRPAHGLVFWGGRQTAGHGRGGRNWVSDVGGLYVSAVLPAGPPILPADTGWVPLMTALACAEQLEARLGLRASIKWPNDLLIDGYKVAGVLGDVVATPSGAAWILAMGLNWRNDAAAAPAGAAPPAALTRWRPGLPLEDRGTFMLAWLERLAEWQAILAGGGDDRLRAAAEARLWSLGQPVRLERTELGLVEGTLLGLGPGGAALMQLAGGRRMPVHCGAIGALPAAPPPAAPLFDSPLIHDESNTMTER